jgi:hypothetical protein
MYVQEFLLLLLLNRLPPDITGGQGLKNIFPPLDPITKASDLDPVFECEMLKKVVRLDKIIS